MSTKVPAETNGGRAAEPLISSQPSTIEDKEPEGAVYKSTVDKIEFKQSQQFIGLTKEELEEYANDPFWRRLRYIFVILFWLSWIGLFSAAIVLVIVSPKCPPKPHRHWWEKKICYEIWTKSFKDSDGDGIGDLRGLTDQLPLLEATVKASAIWPTPLLKSADSDGVGILDFKAVDPKQGGMHDFDRLVRQTHKHGMHLVIDIPLTVVSVEHEWFNKSAKNQAGFEDFFHWSNVAKEGYFQHASKKYYRYWNGKNEFALLNWESAGVKTAMKDVLKFWLDKRVDGFYFGEIQYLILNNAGEPQWDKIHDTLKDLNQYMREDQQEKDKILTFTSAGVNEPLQKIDIDEFKLHTRVRGDVDYVVSSELTKIDASCKAACFYEHLDKVIKFHDKENISWPMWEFGHAYTSRIATRLDSRDRSNMAMMLLMILPGSVNVYYGDEIGMVDSQAPSVSKQDKPRSSMQWTSEDAAGATTAASMKIPANPDYTAVNFKNQQSSDSTLRMFKRLATLRRNEDAFLYGGMELGSKNDDVLIVLSSSNHSTTDFLTVLNFGSQKVINLVDDTSPYFVNVSSKESFIVTTTPNLAATKLYKDRQPIDLAAVSLDQNQGVVIKLKPSK